MKAYERLTKITTSTLGSLDFAATHNTKLKHLYYKRDENGFMLFMLYTHKCLKDNHFSSYIPYTLPKMLSEHTTVFRVLPTQNLKIIEQPGLLINKDQESITGNFYTVNQTRNPFTTTPETFVFNNKRMVTWFKRLTIADELKQKAAAEKDNETKERYEAAANTLNDAAEVIAPPELTRNAVSFKSLPVVPKLHKEGFLNFVKSFLKENESAFIPFPISALNQKECEYLCFIDFKEQIQNRDLLPQHLYLLEYLTAEEKAPLDVTSLENYLAQKIEEYEKELLQEYQSKEERIRIEQEQRRQIVAENHHYKDRGSSRTKGKKHTKRQEQASLNHAQQERMKTTTQKNKNESISRAQERLEKLKNGSRSLKFRNYLKMVNAIAHEMAFVDIEISRELNKSSHGKFKVEGSKPATFVRPHGKHKTVSPKGVKKT